MAYMSQEMKKELAPAIKAVLKKYNMKGFIGVENNSSLVVNIKQGTLDLVENWLANHKYETQYNTQEMIDGWVEETRKQAHIQVNPYCIDWCYSGECESFLSELIEAMMIGNHNNSDAMTDYFDVGWYININIGKWNKPYQVVTA